MVLQADLLVTFRLQIFPMVLSVAECPFLIKLRVLGSCISTGHCRNRWTVLKDPTWTCSEIVFPCLGKKGFRTTRSWTKWKTFFAGTVLQLYYFLTLNTTNFLKILLLHLTLDFGGIGEDTCGDFCTASFRALLSYYKINKQHRY